MTYFKGLLIVLRHIIIIIMISILLYMSVNIWLNNYTNYNKKITIPDIKNMQLEEAINKLKKLELTYEIDSSTFYNNIQPNKVVNFYPHAGYISKKGRRVFIKSNPSKLPLVEIPDLIGKSKRIAMTHLNICGILINKIIYEPDIAKDIVLKIILNGKNLKTGQKILKYSKIDLVLGKGVENNVKTPMLINLEYKKALNIIKNKMFEIGNIHTIGECTDSTQCMVVYQYPYAGEIYDQGQPIDIWISNQPYNNVKNKINNNIKNNEDIKNNLDLNITENEKEEFEID